MQALIEGSLLLRLLVAAAVADEAPGFVSHTGKQSEPGVGSRRERALVQSLDRHGRALRVDHCIVGVLKGPDRQICGGTVRTVPLLNSSSVAAHRSDGRESVRMGAP